MNDLDFLQEVEASYAPCETALFDVVLSRVQNKNEKQQTTIDGVL